MKCKLAPSFHSPAHSNKSLQRLTATHCNTLQHTATHCNTLQHTATHCDDILQVIDKGDITVQELIDYFKTEHSVTCSAIGVQVCVRVRVSLCECVCLRVSKLAVPWLLQACIPLPYPSPFCHLLLSDARSPECGDS